MRSVAVLLTVTRSVSPSGVTAAVTTRVSVTSGSVEAERGFGCRRR